MARRINKPTSGSNSDDEQTHGSGEASVDVQGPVQTTESQAKNAKPFGRRTQYRTKNQRPITPSILNESAGDQSSYGEDLNLTALRDLLKEIPPELLQQHILLTRQTEIEALIAPTIARMEARLAAKYDEHLRHIKHEAEAAQHTIIETYEALLEQAGRDVEEAKKASMLKPENVKTLTRREIVRVLLALLIAAVGIQLWSGHGDTLLDKLLPIIMFTLGYFFDQAK